MAGWHEDFEDEPSCEEQQHDVLECCDCGECDECGERLWHEWEQDHFLAQQELEDFEGLSGWNEEYNDVF